MEHKTKLGQESTPEQLDQMQSISDHSYSARHKPKSSPDPEWTEADQELSIPCGKRSTRISSTSPPPMPTQPARGTGPRSSLQRPDTGFTGHPEIAKGLNKWRKLLRLPKLTKAIPIAYNNEQMVWLTKALAITEVEQEISGA